MSDFATRFSDAMEHIVDANAMTAEASMTVAEQVFRQAKLLPQPLAQEALDFVLFLHARLERGQWRDLETA